MAKAKAIHVETKSHVAEVTAQNEVTAKVTTNAALKHFTGVTKAWAGQTIGLVCSGTFYLLVAHHLSPGDKRPSAQESYDALREHVDKMTGVGEQMIGLYLSLMRKFGIALVKAYKRSGIMVDLATAADSETAVAILVAYCNTHKIGTLATLADYCNGVTPEERKTLDAAKAKAKEQAIADAAANASIPKPATKKPHGKGGSTSVTMEAMIKAPVVLSSAINKRPDILGKVSIDDCARIMHDRNPDEFGKVMLSAIDRVEHTDELQSIIKAAQARLVKMKAQLAAVKGAAPANAKAAEAQAAAA